MSHSINVGQYDQRVMLQQPTPGRDDAGQPLTTFSDVGEAWAKVRPTRGRDFVAADGKQATIDVQFCLRYRADVLSTWRVLWGGIPYDIQGEPVNVKGARVELELNCIKGVRDARS